MILEVFDKIWPRKSLAGEAVTENQWRPSSDNLQPDIGVVLRYE
jgi:hypothetical protein